MGQLVSLFRKKRENDDFETILNELDDSIRIKEENLAFIKQRERRAIILFTSYSILIWALYALVWWFGLLASISSSSSYQTVDGNGETVFEEEDIGSRIVKTIPVGAIPILIFFTRRIVKAWYRRKQEAENKQLTTLRKKQHDQIDKLKKLSNYDKITEMLERHGQVIPRSASGVFPPGTPIKQQAGAGPGGSRAGSAYSTPVGGQSQQQRGPGGMSLTPAQQRAMSHQKQQMQQQHQKQQQQQGSAVGNTGTSAQQGKKIFPAPPGSNTALPPGFAADLDDFTPPSRPKSFIDKVADVLLGGDEQSPASKYALICQKCFAHNGLVMKDEVMDVQFMCPKCGHFNPSRRARKTGQIQQHQQPQQQYQQSSISRPNSRSSNHHHHTATTTESRHGRSSLGLSEGTILAAADDGDDDNNDDSLMLSSPTTSHSPLNSAAAAGVVGGAHSSSSSTSASDYMTDGDVQDQDGLQGDVSMEQEEAKADSDRLTSSMNADERKENLRRRLSRKEGKS